MLRVSLEHRFPGTALSISFEAPTPGVVALFGPSGAGKSSLLQAIAGLLRADDVRVELDGVALHDLPPERRGIGVVFQEGRLFPHMSVSANLRYGLRRTGPGPVAFADVVDLLGLSALLPRRPGSLSGGERQRVAIGRALLSQPRLLLMDEPLSALDQARRNEILPYLAKLRSVFAIPIVYASHALEEVVRLADTVVLIEAGRVRACGPLGEIASRVDLPLASREDAVGVLTGTVAAHAPERRLTGIGCGPDVVWVPLLDVPPGRAVRLLVPAREVILALDPPRAVSVNNILPATVSALAEDPPGHAALVGLSLGGGHLLARVTLDAARRLDLRTGTPVLALIKSMSVELQKH
jgi:molybdate transport system ATP-binding protein